ncbi:MAG: DnaD domain-containing protein [Candidatus Villigracilaceae bacterium]
MKKFPGFSEQDTFTSLPDILFQRLRDFDDLNEIKILLYALWRVAHTEGPFHALSPSDFEPLEMSDDDLRLGLDKAVSRGTLIRVRRNSGVFYFLNSPRGRAASEAIRNGIWHPHDKPASGPPRERPNIFRLYEENIGPLTPLLADTLKEAEQIYPAEWIAEAIQIAVERNKRNWKYIEAILKRWKKEGHAKKQTGGDAEKDAYTDSQFAEYLKQD